MHPQNIMRRSNRKFRTLGLDALRHLAAAIYVLCIAVAVGVAIGFAALDSLPDSGWYAVVSGLALLAVAFALST